MEMSDGLLHCKMICTTSCDNETEEVDEETGLPQCTACYRYFRWAEWAASKGVSKRGYEVRSSKYITGSERRKRIERALTENNMGEWEDIIEEELRALWKIEREYEALMYTARDDRGELYETPALDEYHNAEKGSE